MKYRHLHIFKTVCDLGNMTHAAHELHMSQPSVSQVIKELEVHYHVVLFERFGRKLFITEDGRSLLNYATRIIALYDEAEQVLSNKSKTLTRIGATVTIGTYLLGPWLENYERKSCIRTSMHNTKLLEEKLLKADLDLGLVEGRIDSNDLVVRPFMEDELVVIVSKKHPLAGLSKIRPEALQDQSLFIREEGSGSRRIFLDWLQKHTVSMRILGEMTSNEAIIHAVACDLGYGVVSRSALLDQEDVLVLDLACEPMIRQFSLVHHKDKAMTDGIVDIIHHIMRFKRTSL